MSRFTYLWEWVFFKDLCAHHPRGSSSGNLTTDNDLDVVQGWTDVSAASLGVTWEVLAYDQSKSIAFRHRDRFSRYLRCRSRLSIESPSYHRHNDELTIPSCRCNRFKTIFYYRYIGLTSKSTVMWPSSPAAPSYTVQDDLQRQYHRRHRNMKTTSGWFSQCLLSNVHPKQQRWHQYR